MGKIYNLSHEMHEEIAKLLYDADINNSPIPRLTETYSNITIDDAYAIQEEGLKLRLADGNRVCGRKIGITSKGMMEMLHCDSPDYGYLLERTEVEDGGVIIANKMNLPMVEGEIAFMFEEDLPSRPITEEDIIRINPYVVPCFEICDVRYPSWKVSILDTIPDNAAASKFVLGKDKKRLFDVDVVNIKMTMKKNGTIFGEGLGKEVMGNPVTSVTWLANKLFEYGARINKGDVILSGALIKADPAKAGDSYSTTFEGFNTITVSFK